MAQGVWATSADGSVAYAAGATYTGNANLSLYAQWTATNYTISYDLGGGSVATENPTGYTIESAAFTLNNPTKFGCAFAGWTGTDLVSATQTVTIAAGSTGNRSYTATWNDKTYTSYTVTGGSVEGYNSMFDNNTGTKWCIRVNSEDGSSNVGNLWVEFYTPAPIVPTGYILTTANDTETQSCRNPKNWVLKGKLNSTDEWTVIDTKVNDATMPAANYTPVTFSLSGIDGAYQYFRFEVTQVHGKDQWGDYLFQMSELQLKGNDAADVTAAAATDALIGAICSPVQYTEACVTAINAARAAYDDLSADGKALVANLAALTTAEAALDEADEAMAWAANEDTDPDHAGDYYSTFYHSAVRYSLPEGTEAYIATLSSDALNLKRIAVAGDVIPEDNAVILKGNSSSITLTPSLADPVSVDPAQNSLQGEDGVTDTPANCYVLSGRSSDNTVTGVGFYKYEGEKIPAHKAFVVISSKANSPKRLRFVFNETNTATGIEQVEGQNGTEPVESTKELRDGQLIIIRGDKEYNAQGQMVK